MSLVSCDLQKFESGKSLKKFLAQRRDTIAAEFQVDEGRQIVQTAFFQTVQPVVTQVPVKKNDIQFITPQHKTNNKKH